jgi:hypothetical protein
VKRSADRKNQEHNAVKAMKKNKAIASAINGTVMAYTRSGVPVIHFDASGHLTNYFEEIHERGQPGIPSRIVLSRISG